MVLNKKNIYNNTHATVHDDDYGDDGDDGDDPFHHDHDLNLDLSCKFLPHL